MSDTLPRFKAAVVQDHPVFLDRKETVEKACNLMRVCRREGALLVAFPEAFVPGYPYWVWINSPPSNRAFFEKLFREAVAVSSPAVEQLCQGAREADIYVLIGIVEKVPTQMGTMWCTNLLIDNRGTLLGKHRKIVPTFAEKTVWACGDGSGLRVWETDLGRIGTLACGNNVHSLYRYALLAQGEQIHIANFPALDRNPKASVPRNLVMALSHSLEGKVYTLVSSGTVGADVVDRLSDGDDEKKKWLDKLDSHSCIVSPAGEVLAEIIGGEGIACADIDLAEEIAPKQLHDTLGSYTRADVVSLNLRTQQDRLIWSGSDLNEKALCGAGEMASEGASQVPNRSEN